MASSREIQFPANELTIRRKGASIAVVGTPNCGKSTLFNRLTGLRQRIGNYPGVTVEKHVGTLTVDHQTVELVDLPGTHSLSAHSFEEQIAIDVIFGRIEGTADPDGILAVLDATNLYQGMFLMQQLVNLGKPMVIALTMSDAADKSGIDVDIVGLSDALGGAKVVKVVATTGSGMDELRRAIVAMPGSGPTTPLIVWPDLSTAARKLHAKSNDALQFVQYERLLVDGVTEHNSQYIDVLDDESLGLLKSLRDELFGMEPPLAVEARVRYAWVREQLQMIQSNLPAYQSWVSRIVEFVNRPIPGTIGLFLVMAIVFQSVFAWATPMMEWIDGVAAALGASAAAALGDGWFSSLIADGVIAGVGSVIVFLPQILILFLFVIVLEDTGYLARAAYLMDRVMRSIGLSGQSIIPMISSFACAVPGIMATRVIPNRRDRIATILAAPFMTCSARLPVYALLIAAFVPAQTIGFLNLQGLVLFGLYLFGIVMGILTAFLMKQTALRGPKPPFALMLPEFRKPNFQTVVFQLLGRAKAFLYRAGTMIFTVTVIVWVLLYFPRADELAQQFDAQRAQAAAIRDGDELIAELERIDNEAAAAQLEQSYLGRAGHAIEPAFKPLGWDWRVSSAVIAGFPAREVVVAVLGTIYAVGDEAEDAVLAERLRSSAWPDGSPVFTLPMVIGLLIFYALCLQCAATIATIRRETNSWRWPIFAWTYMTALGYVGALLVYQLGSA